VCYCTTGNGRGRKTIIARAEYVSTVLLFGTPDLFPVVDEQTRGLALMCESRVAIIIIKVKVLCSQEIRDGGEKPRSTSRMT